MSANPRDLWSLLAQPAALTAAGVFVVEGREAIARLLRTDHEVVSLLLTPAARVALQSAIDAWSRQAATNGRLGETDLPTAVVEVTPAQMREVTGFNFHRGALAMAKRPRLRSVDDLLASPAYRGTHPCGADVAADHDGRRPSADRRSLFVVLEHLVDVDNVGSCFRNARAFGASAVLLDDRCADPLYRKAVRTSMGTVLEVPWTIAPIGAVVDALQSRGIATIGLTPEAGAQDLECAVGDIHATAPIALVVGNEGHGLSADTLSRCTHRARIPMALGADSLNVATALAVGLYACW